MKEDLPPAPTDEYTTVLPAVFIPLAGTLEMFEIDKVALSIPSGRRRMHLWTPFLGRGRRVRSGEKKKKEKKNQKTNKSTVADRARVVRRVQHLWLPTRSLRLSSEICYSVNLQSGTRCCARQSAEEAKCPGRLVPARRDVSYLFRVSFIYSHSHMLFSTQGSPTRSHQARLRACVCACGYETTLRCLLEGV